MTKLLRERPRRSQALGEFPDPKAALVKRIFPTEATKKTPYSP